MDCAAGCPGCRLLFLGDWHLQIDGLKGAMLDMEKVTILCDANMPFAAEAFSRLGQVRLLDGRQIGPSDVRDVDILATRSTTRVDRELLEHSRVRFYGTATIGYDHVDTAYLEARGIPWTAAPGCNAESVAQYVTAALTSLALDSGRDLAGMTLGIIGVGNVGRRVVAKARALGMCVLANDPPRQRDLSDRDAQSFVSLDQVLAESDVITVHTPLNIGGADQTLGLLNLARLLQCRRGTWLINAARGEVIPANDLQRALDRRHFAYVVLDTWEHEPAFCRSLLERVSIATPHIAGHSYEGKVNGTLMLYEAACRLLGVEPDYLPVMPEPPTPVWHPLPSANFPRQVADAVRATYDIREDDRRMRESTDPAVERDRAAAFDRLRKTYPMRREFSATRVPAETLPDALADCLGRLGFSMRARNGSATDCL